MEQITKKRIYCFDLLKVISILIVFMHHIMMDLYIVHPMHNLKILETLILRPNMNLGMIACGLFVLISGATLALKGREEEPVSFYKKRLIRVLVPFYIAYIIYFIIRVITYKTIFIYGGIPKWRFIFTLIGMDEYLSANGVATFSLGVGEWFLGCILLCYIAYPFIFRLHKKYKLFTFLVMTAWFLFINFNYARFNFIIPSHMNFLCQIYNFYLGILLIDKETLARLKRWLLVITIPIILFFYFYNKMILIPDNLKTTIVLVSIFVTFYELEDIISSIDFIKVFTVFFNKISLEIYLVHH
ncbi:MAG: acyltransferase family protein, partial [Lachnospiraceae bacterium]|nr:acyltransferase family protein [Lachnospiraceae bacterium]